MTDLLLDTHALLWLLLQPNLLSPGAAGAISGAATLRTSAATVFEITTKYRLGKLPQAQPLLALGWPALASQYGIAVVPVTAGDADYAGLHPSPHRDPWDRLIAAQAARRNVPVVSNDPSLDAFPVTRVW